MIKLLKDCKRIKKNLFLHEVLLLKVKSNYRQIGLINY